MKLLIIEDEKELSQNIVSYLDTENYLCEQAFTFDEAMEKIHLFEYDCIILDLMLPGGNGMDILLELKRQNISAGVIIVSAKDSLDDKIKGLKYGADDYLPKPFHMSELSMRIYALIRRQQFKSNNVLISNELHLDLLSKTVSFKNTEINLTRTEYELLLFFISNKNKVISKNALAEHVSGDMADMFDDQDFIYSHIKNLRAKLLSVANINCIKNIYGTGYKWIE